MSKRAKIVNTILLFVLLFIFLYGAVVIHLRQKYKNNDVSFKINHSQAYFSVDGKFFLGEKDFNNNITHSTYSDSYTIDDYYSNEEKKLKTWNVGLTPFYIDDENPENSIREMYYKITLHNLNEVNDLYFKISGVAVDSALNFLTKIIYTSQGESEKIIYSNDPLNNINTNKYGSSSNYINITDEEKINVGGNVEILIIFSLNNKVNPINAKNNMVVEVGLL